jgi:hypothetical protein
MSVKYIFSATVYMPVGLPVHFKVECDDIDNPPMYDGDNGMLNIKINNEWKTFGNLPFVWTREALQQIKQEEFKNGNLFAHYFKDLPRQIFSYSREDNKGFLLIHEDGGKYKPTHRVEIADIQYMEFIQLKEWMHNQNESTVRLQFSNLYKLNL